jgi:D-alanyl-D-alanine carboxypeptidase
MKRITLILAILFSQVVPTWAVDIPVTCASRDTYELRTSNVMIGCEDSEISLGEGPIPISNLPKFELDSTLRYRFLAAQAAARKDGVHIEITSGFRSIERQRYLFNRALVKYGSYLNAARWVAPPEISRHPLGLAIDVNYPNDPEEVKWLERNGFKFGLCRTFKNEWWHFEGNIAPGWKCPKMMKDATALLKR